MSARKARTVGYLSRDGILAAKDMETEDVDVPAWGGRVRVRGMTGSERDAFEAALLNNKGQADKRNLANFRAKLVVLCVVDEEGNRLFADADVGLLGKKSASAIEVVFDVARRLSGMSQADVEEMAANLSETPGDGSS